jgi:hypothetical protein
MSTPVQRIDEATVLSSLCGMTLAGLRAMQGRPSNIPISHLILQAIGLKEDESKEAGTHTRKLRTRNTKRPV